MATAGRQRTHARLVAAASALFAERGFRGTTIRAIAARAGANVAAAHYHFGSKEALYLAVLRAQFAEVRGRLAAEGAAPTPAELARRSRGEVAAALATRVRAMLAMLLGPPPGLHGTLMQREMCDPSEALPVIVSEFVEPVMAETRAMLARLAPRLDEEGLERCASSIMGQALFYRFAMPVVLRRWGRRAYSAALIDDLAEHITRFSLAGVETRAGGGRRRRRAR